MKAKRNEHPILFSTDMVKAILEGRKTQTRRILKKTPKDGNHYSIDKLKYKIGDILWVREAFYEASYENTYRYFYRADLEPQGWKFKWKPSIFMTKKAARIFLKITNIRIERLQDITEADAIAEGVEKHSDYGSTGYIDYLHPDNALTNVDAIRSFQSLWEKINGNGSWNENPLVIIIDFKRIKIK